jgi:UDP-N-acetylmuramate-alanine ligase
MSFIGIICTPKQERYIKQTLNNSISSSNIILLKEENIDNFKNITFETIAIFSKKSNTFEKKEVMLKIIEKAKYIIINIDEEIIVEELKNIKANIISYGFNTKSIVTASSVDDDSMLICLQKVIISRIGNKIEEQEILVPLQEEYKVNTNTIMGVIAILLVYEKQPINV